MENDNNSLIVDPGSGFGIGGGTIDNMTSPGEVNNPDPLPLSRRNDDNDLLQSQYDFTSLAFPSDIDMNYLGHYMVININVPVDLNGKQRGSRRTIDYSGGDAGVLNEYSKVDVLRFGNIPGGESNGLNAAEWSWPRATRRLRYSIALQMPTPMIYTSVQRFEEISLTAMAGSGLGALASGLAGALTSYSAGLLNAGIEAGQAATGGLFNGASKYVGAAAGLTGFPIDPRVEIIFSNTDQRQFAFEVLMAPRNPQESIAIKNIIRALRFYSAPELTTDVTSLLPLYIPPAEFDITFFTRGEENTNIPRINTCVLERTEVDYAPTGVYSTFTNGQPVAVRLSMGFREIEPLHKLRILQGF